MNLNPHRPWITPLVIGAFLLSAVTGVLMFFHLDTGLNKLAHEWLSWAMLAGVCLHVLLNLTAFKRYFLTATGRWVILAFAALLVLSFIPATKTSKPLFVGPVQALARAPLPVLAQVAGISTEELHSKLSAAGFTTSSDQQSLQDLVGSDTRRQMQILNRLIPPNQP